MPAIIVLGEAASAKWVLEHQAMGFTGSAVAKAKRRLASGDRIALYTTRGAFHNPTRDQSQVFALGGVTTPVEDEPITINQHTYEASCRLRIDRQLPLREGVPFRQLVEDLGFIAKKRGWSTYMRSVVVSISDADYALIERTFERYRS